MGAVAAVVACCAAPALVGGALGAVAGASLGAAAALGLLVAGAAIAFVSWKAHHRGSSCASPNINPSQENIVDDLR